MLLLELTYIAIVTSHDKLELRNEAREKDTMEIMRDTGGNGEARKRFWQSTGCSMTDDNGLDQETIKVSSTSAPFDSIINHETLCRS